MKLACRCGTIAIACLLLAATAGAQPNFVACAPGSALSGDGAARTAANPLLDLNARMAGYNKLLAQHPEDLFANRRYMAEFAGYSKRPLFDQIVLTRYRALYRQDPKAPAHIYLYALANARRDRQKSIEALESLNGPWPQLSLATLRSREKDAAQKSLDIFLAQCPATLDTEALNLIADLGSEPLRQRTAERLRKQLAESGDEAALAAWPILWQLEFQLTPPADHAQLRKQIGADVEWLRQLKGVPMDARLDTMRQGYRLAQDSAGAKSVQEELMRLAPATRAAATATIERWQEEHPAAQNTRDRSAQALLALDAGESWIRQWPNFEDAWRPILRAVLSVHDLPADRLAALGRGLLDCLRRNPDFTLGYTDPPVLMVAERLANEGLELDRVRQAVAWGVKQAEQRLESDLAAGGGPLGAARVQGDTVIWRWEGRKILIAVELRSKNTTAAIVELEAYRKEVAVADVSDRLTLWSGLTGLASSAIDAGRKDIARETLARMSSVLADNPHSTNAREEILRSVRESNYWKAKATFAEKDDRPLDASAYYRRAAEAMPAEYDPASRAELAAAAQRVWTALGGTPEAFETFGHESAATPNRWIAASRTMPAFSLPDLDGRTVRLDELAGKVLFINVWATWCGPCQSELPHLQKIYEQLKDRHDVRVLTLNIDDNPGVVDQYMKQNNFSFPVLLAREFVEEQLKLETIPRNWIVDGAGKVRLDAQTSLNEGFVDDVLAGIARVSGK